MPALGPNSVNFPKLVCIQPQSQRVNFPRIDYSRSQPSPAHNNHKLILMKRLWPLINKMKLEWMKVFRLIQKPNQNQKLKHMKNNQFLKSLMPQRIIRMIYNSKYHLLLEMMLYIWVQYIWAHQRVNQLEQFSILVQSIQLLPVPSATIKPQGTLNSRNMIHYQVLSYKEIN